MPGDRDVDAMLPFGSDARGMRACRTHPGRPAVPTLGAVLILAALAAAAAAPVAAGTPPPTAKAESPASSEPMAPATEEPTAPVDYSKLIPVRIQQVQASQLDEADKKKALDAYRQASEHLEAVQTLNIMMQGFDREIQAAPEKIQRAREELAAFPARPAITIPAQASVHELQQELSQLEARLARERQEFEDAVDKLNRRRLRIRGELTMVPQTARSKLSRVEEQLEALPSDDSLLVQAQRIQLQAERRFLNTQIARYTREADRNQAEAELLPLERDLARVRLNHTEEVVKAWREGVDKRRRDEQEHQARQARRQLAESAAFEAYPAVRELAEENARLVELRKASTDRIEELNSEVDEVDAKTTRISAEFSQARKKLDALGNTSEVGRLLRRQRANLPAVQDLRRKIQARQSELREVEIGEYELAARRTELADLDKRVSEVVSQLDPPPPEDRRRGLESFISRLLETKREHLGILIAEYEIYAGKLADLAREERALLAATEEYGRYIGERVLWISSTEPLTRHRMSDAATGARWLVQPARWAEVGRGLVEDAVRHPVLFAAACLAFLTLLVLQRPIRRQIAQFGELAERGTTVDFRPTLKALMLTGAVALLWPWFAWHCGWRLTMHLEAAQPEGETLEFLSAVSSGLMVLAMIFLPIEFFRLTCRPKGLAESHFHWPSSGLRVLRRNLRWLNAVALPLAFVAAVMHAQSIGAQGHEEWQVSLGRLCFIAALALTALFLHQALRARGGALDEAIAYRPGSWLERMRPALHAAGLVVPLSLAALAAAGYQYTAEQLVLRLYATLWIVLGLVILAALVQRWSLLTRRRLAMEQLRQRREAAAAAAAGEQTSPLPADLPDVAQDAALDASEMDAQTRQLLKSCLVLAAVLGLWFVWVDVLPALSVLRQVEVWSLSVDRVLPGAGTGEEGEPRTVTDLVPITLADVSLAVLILIITVVATKNMPGLLEMTVLQRLPLDAAARYAVSTLARYAIMIVGVVSACRVLGLGWQNVQLVAAAITLGLGFGLQEIFANFVSGLIILFERPVRVGDVVTVGDVTGVVSRIRMRATTITNWERKEMIIPNKELITGRVMNWTLTDQITRVLIVVGIAYGSDTKRATELLYKVVGDHEMVLKDPQPVVTFASFGDSSLDFEVRAYLPALDCRLAVVHELHTAIDLAFREEGIEIAFPQRDLHIRSIDRSLVAPAAREGRNGGPGSDGGSLLPAAEVAAAMRGFRR